VCIRLGNQRDFMGVTFFRRCKLVKVLVLGEDGKHSWFEATMPIWYPMCMGAQRELFTRAHILQILQTRGPMSSSWGSTTCPIGRSHVPISFILHPRSHITQPLLSFPLASNRALTSSYPSGTIPSSVGKLSPLIGP